jgi:predicted protein tyrosine phosphatase
MNILFVCTHHVARSPMAAALFTELAGPTGRYMVRSAGLATNTSRRLTTREMAWADVVAVMEPAHSAVIARRWPNHAAKVWVLDVPDDYDPEEPELRALLTPKLRALLEELGATEPTR